MKTPSTLLLSIALLTALALAACDDDEPAASSDATATSPAATASTPASEGAARVNLIGRLTLDGAPLDADFLGARIIHNGLAAACQGTLPAVTAGEYEIAVLSDPELRGCGAPGAEIILWAFANDTYYFTNETLPWPGAGLPAAFDGTFSSATPNGAATPVTELKGHIYDRDGNELPSGTVIEAFAGDTLCGVTALRDYAETEGIYTLVVAGPQSVPGCAEGATLTFRLNGEPAGPTAINMLAPADRDSELDLTLQ
jgi:hypothetical protein